MTKQVRKNQYLLPFARFFTRGEGDAYDAIPFQSSDSFGDESVPALSSPITWQTESVALMAEAACPSIPAALSAIEENTVPSWLWQHKSRGAGRMTEGDLRSIFNRAVGSATAQAWKLGLFANEKNARTFYDETCFALMQRHIAILPDRLASWGLSWAYGIETGKPPKAAPKNPAATLSNAAIDGVIGHTASPNLWKKLFTIPAKDISKVSLRFSDVAADWYSPDPIPACAAIDLMALRHNDGSVNVDALRQTARSLTVLFDLHDAGDATIGFANLAPLLLALGLAYDSDAGRAMASSLAALVTAECVAASAEMAALRGASETFTQNRNDVMRSLRNHCRAVHGDGNDYEKLSVLPAPLPLRHCPDLILTAEAQRRWDEALEMTRAFGLRATQATDMTLSPVLAILMASASQGLEPMQRLTSLRQDENDHYHTTLHPAVSEALARLDYPHVVANAAAQHIAGACSLRRAPVINHASLRALGFSDTVLEKIESYLPCVDKVTLAVTPWIVGVDFCRTALKIPARTLQSPRFDLLRHLGFSDTDCAAANLYCYGHGTLRNAKILPLRHRPLFACGAEISVEARLRMTAAVQSFISGDTGMIAHLPVAQSAQNGADIAITAWRRGLKSLTIVFDPALEAPVRKASATTRRIGASSQSHTKAAAAPARSLRNGKSARGLEAKKPATSRRTAHKAH